MHGRMPWSWAGLLTLALCGCGGHARVELAAADALDGLAGELTMALDEFRGDLSSADDQREAAVVDAFIERVRRDVEDEALLARHDEQFRAALAKIQADRQTAWERYDTARDNVVVTREVSSELRRMALAGLTLEAEAREYVETLIAAQHSLRESKAAESASGRVDFNP